MSSGFTLQDLLAVEDDPGLLEFTCPETRVPLWAVIRNPLLRFIMSDRLFTNSLVHQERGAAFRRNSGGAIYAVVRATGHNIRHRQSLRARVMLATGGSALLLKNGSWFNRLSDYFASACAPQTVILEDLYKWQWRFPRHHPQILFHTPFFLQGYLAGQLRVRQWHARNAEALVALVRARAKRLLDWEMGEQRAGFLAQLLARQAAAMPTMSRAYEKLLTRLQARVVIKEMGCYGKSAVFNATARDMGLTVAEYQHGMVSAGHDAYNVAAALSQSHEYRRTLPEHFLSYGAWWGEQMNAPVLQRAIGNPHRAEQLGHFNRRPAEKRDVLILGDGIETKSYLSLARALAERLPRRWRVVFRPHPLERDRLPTVEREGSAGVHFDVRADIYESFASAQVVVSEASTGLFESVGLVERIFVLETERGRFSLPRHPFASCADADDLAQMIADESSGRPDLSGEERVWASGWQRNYLDFLRAPGDIAPATRTASAG